MSGTWHIVEGSCGDNMDIWTLLKALSNIKKPIYHVISPTWRSDLTSKCSSLGIPFSRISALNFSRIHQVKLCTTMTLS